MHTHQQLPGTAGNHEDWNGFNIILWTDHLPRFIWTHYRHKHSQRQHHHLSGFIGTAGRNCDREEVITAGVH